MTFHTLIGVFCLIWRKMLGARGLAGIILCHQHQLITKKLKIMTSNFTTNGESRNESKKNGFQQLKGMSAVRILVVTMALVVSLPMMGQIGLMRLGLRTGVSLDKGSVGRDMLDSGNQIGFSSGVVLDINVPIVGLGVEASAMYTHRSGKIAHNDEVFKGHYIDIPVYARYRLSLPVAEKVIAPYAFTGPNFSVLFKEGESNTKENSKTSVSWNVGAGVDLLNHIRLSATYSISTAKYQVNNGPDEGSRSKDNCWTVSAAYMF